MTGKQTCTVCYTPLTAPPNTAPAATVRVTSQAGSTAAPLGGPSNPPAPPPSHTPGVATSPAQSPTMAIPAVPGVTAEVRMALDGQAYVVEPTTRWGGPQPPNSAPVPNGFPGTGHPPSLPGHSLPSNRTGVHARGAGGVNKAVTIALVGMLVVTVSVIGAMWWWKFLRPGPYPLTSKLRYYMEGDQWDYTVNASVGLQNLSLGDLRATMQVKIVNATLEDQPVLARKSHFAFKSTIPLNLDSTEYIRQDSQTGDVYKIGEKTGAGTLPRLDRRPKLDTPGSFSKEMELKSEGLEGFTEAHQTKRVVGTEIVSTPAGDFHTWKMETTGGGMSGNMSADVTATEWVCPQLGMPVKITASGSDSMGAKFEMTMILQSTNVKMKPGKPGS
jgi:hypothetical protein